MSAPPGSAVLSAINVWFPDDTVLLAALPDMVDLGEAGRAEVEQVGVAQVRDAGPMTEVDLAAEAAGRTLTAAGLDAGELDGLVMVGGRVPEYLMSSEATRLQHRLGAHRATVLGVGDLGCVSVSAAVDVARGQLAVHPEWRAVLVAMGVRSPTARRYRPPMTVLGDGGMAFLVTPDGPRGFRVLDHLLESDGRYADLFVLRYRDEVEPDWVEECTDPAGYSFRLSIESRNRFLALRRRLLERAGLDAAKLGGYVMQNLSAGAFAFWGEALGADFLASCEQNLRRFGHMGPMDVLLNLATAPGLAEGDRVLVLNSSPVAAWSASLVERLGDDDTSMAGGLP